MVAVLNLFPNQWILMFWKNNIEFEIDEFGAVIDKDSGLLVEFPVEENPIQISLDHWKIEKNFIFVMHFIILNYSDVDQVVYSIRFKGIPDYFIYRTSKADVGIFDKHTFQWLVGTIPAETKYYLTLIYKFTKPLKDFHVDYEIELI